MVRKMLYNCGHEVFGSPSAPNCIGVDPQPHECQSPVGPRRILGARPPILEPIFPGMGRFTGATIWVLTHGHVKESSRKGLSMVGV